MIHVSHAFLLSEIYTTGNYLKLCLSQSFSTLFSYFFVRIEQMFETLKMKSLFELHDYD